MSEKYDVVIIGAGIGGLTCGCYLAKAGLKVLIVEQHNKPGGYCTSFNRKGFIFDAGVHCLGSLRQGGMLNKILLDLKLLNSVDFARSEPTDRIIFPNKTVFIRKDKFKTKNEFICHFPKEKNNIDRFFKFILNDDFLYIYSKIKKLSFKEFTDSFFKDSELKNILATLLGNIGMPPSLASAVISSVVFREFVLDGGYYPVGGMQGFSDLFSNKFKEYGGEIRFNERVSEILVNKKRHVSGVATEHSNIFQAKFIVSNMDATKTFQQLVPFSTPEKKKVDDLIPSSSAFILYLGLNKLLNIKPKHFTTLLFNDINIEKCYSNKKNLWELRRLKYMFCTFSSLIDPTLAPPGKSTVRIFIGVSGEGGLLYSNDRKTNIRNKIIRECNNLVGNIVNNIEVEEIATPETFMNYTSNRNGSIFGWAANPQQVVPDTFPYYTSIANLFLAGHWVTNGAGQSGVAVVAFSGKRTAEKIMGAAIRK